MSNHVGGDGLVTATVKMDALLHAGAKILQLLAPFFPKYWKQQHKTLLSHRCGRRYNFNLTDWQWRLVSSGRMRSEERWHLLHTQSWSTPDEKKKVYLMVVEMKTQTFSFSPADCRNFLFLLSGSVAAKSCLSEGNPTGESWQRKKDNFIREPRRERELEER